MSPLFAINMPSIILLGMIAVMLFGKDLPRMGKKFGKMYAEIMRGYQSVQKEMRSVMREIENTVDEVTDTRRKPTKRRIAAEPEVDKDREAESVAPRFEPPAEM